MHIFRGVYTNLGTFDLLVRMLRSWGKIQVNQHRARSMCTRAAERAILSNNHTPGKHAQMSARIYTYSEVSTLNKEHVIYLCTCVGVGGKLRLINTGRKACAQEQQKVQYSLTLSHAGEAYPNARTHIHIFRGMYTNLRTCYLLVRMLKRWGKIQVNQHRSRRMCPRAAEGAILSHTLTCLGSMRKFAHTYAHIQRYLH